MTLTSAEYAQVQLPEKKFNYSNGIFLGDYRVKSRR